MNRSALWTGELGRKAIHLAMMVLPACILWAPAPWSRRGPVLAFLALLGADFLRLHVPAFGRRLAPRIAGSLRPGEHRGWIYPVHFLTGNAALLAALVPREVAASALAYLVLGDAAAALVGRRFGRHRFGGKSLEGSLACFACCLGIGAVTLPGRPAAIVGGALVATLVEALPIPLDDNLSVPLASAAALALLL